MNPARPIVSARSRRDDEESGSLSTSHQRGDTQLTTVLALLGRAFQNLTADEILILWREPKGLHIRPRVHGTPSAEAVRPDND